MSISPVLPGRLLTSSASFGLMLFIPTKPIGFKSVILVSQIVFPPTFFVTLLIGIVLQMVVLPPPIAACTRITSPFALTLNACPFGGFAPAPALKSPRRKPLIPDGTPFAACVFVISTRLPGAVHCGKSPNPTRPEIGAVLNGVN